jgi:hypothetical protein
MPRKNQNEYNEYMRNKMAEYRRQRKEEINSESVNLTEAVISGDMRGLTKPLLISSLQDIYKLRDINEESFDHFLKKPYTVMPKSEGEWYLIVPKFTNLEYGWPDPVKSGCYFCPFQSPREWSVLYHTHPDLFWDAVALEEQDIKFPTYNLYPRGKSKGLRRLVSGPGFGYGSLSIYDDYEGNACVEVEASCML